MWFGSPGLCHTHCQDNKALILCPTYKETADLSDFTWLKPYLEKARLWIEKRSFALPESKKGRLVTWSTLERIGSTGLPLSPPVLQFVPAPVVRAEQARFESPDPSSWKPETLLEEFIAKGWLRVGEDGALVYTEGRLVRLKEAAEQAAVSPLLNPRQRTASDRLITPHSRTNLTKVYLS